MNLILALILTLSQIALDNKVILVSVADDMEYVDDKPTGKKLGTKYTVVCPKAKYYSFAVKVPDPTPIVTQEMIDASDNPIWVSFEDFVGKFYRLRSSNDYGLSARAAKAVIVKEKG